MVEWMFTYVMPPIMSFMCVVSIVPLPVTVPDWDDVTVSVTMLGPGAPTAAGPWMCATVAGDDRPLNVPTTVTFPFVLLRVTMTFPVAALVFFGVSCVPVNVML